MKEPYLVAKAVKDNSTGEVHFMDTAQSTAELARKRAFAIVREESVEPPEGPRPENRELLGVSFTDDEATRYMDAHGEAMAHHDWFRLVYPELVAPNQEGGRND